MSKLDKFLIYVAKDFTSDLADVICEIYDYKGNFMKSYNMEEIGNTGIYYCFVDKKFYEHKYSIAIIDSATKQWKVCENLYGK